MFTLRTFQICYVKIFLLGAKICLKFEIDFNFQDTVVGTRFRQILAHQNLKCLLNKINPW